MFFHVKLFCFFLLLFLGCSKKEEQVISKIYFEHEQINVEVGKEVRVNVTTEPVKGNMYSYNWRSESPEIATVNNNGYVKGIKEGKTYVTVHNNTLNIEASIVVNVIHPDAQHIQVISSKDDINVGESVLFTYLILPENVDATRYEVEWSVSDENLAFISEEGILTALDEGDVEVTAAIKNTDIQSRKQLKISHIYIEDFNVQNPPVIMYIGVPYKLDVIDKRPANYTIDEIVINVDDTRILSITEGLEIIPLTVGRTTLWVGTKNDPNKYKYTVDVRSSDYKSVDVEYIASNGISVKVTRINGYPQNAQYNYHIINYQLTNNTSYPITETSFQIILKNNNTTRYWNPNFNGVIQPNETVYRTLGRIIPVNEIAESFYYGGLYWKVKEF